MEIGSVFLRCLNWDKKNGEGVSYSNGYHMGKAYNSLWILTKLGLAGILKAAARKKDIGNAVIIDQIFDMGNVGKGRFFIDRDLYGDVMKSIAKDWGKKIAKDISSHCEIIT